MSEDKGKPANVPRPKLGAGKPLPRPAVGSSPSRKGTSSPSRRALPGTSHPPNPRDGVMPPKIPTAPLIPQDPPGGVSSSATPTEPPEPPETDSPPPDSQPGASGDPPPSKDSAVDSDPKVAVPPAQHSAPRRKIGRCELFTEIAHGGMATIHLGRWIGAGGFVKTVAVKALHPQYARDQEFVKMFLDEARVVARIRHPNVMPTIDLVEEGGELFIVMEYIEGVTLSHLMKQMRKRKKGIPVNMALRVMTGVLYGLHAAHEAKDEHGESLCVIHRDVSPENILVGIDGYARLIDFGIASALGRHTKTVAGQVKGKLSYLTPEQVLGDSLNRQSDVFSAAGVLWSALAGRKLFKAKSVAEISMKILNEEIKAPSAMQPGLTKKYDSIVLRGLERNPQKRWATAERMAEALEALGGLASHRQVGEWVREVAADKLAQVDVVVKTVEQAPKSTSIADLERPMSIHPAPPDALPDGPTPPIEAWGISEEDVSRTDVTAGANAPRISMPEPAKQKPLWLYGLAGAAAVALVAYLGFGGGDETQPGSPGPATTGQTGATPSKLASPPAASTITESVAAPIASDDSLDAGQAPGQGAGGAGAGGKGAGGKGAGGDDTAEPATSASATPKPPRPTGPRPKTPKVAGSVLIPDDI